MSDRTHELFIISLLILLMVNILLLDIVVFSSYLKEPASVSVPSIDDKNIKQQVATDISKGGIYEISSTPQATPLETPKKERIQDTSSGSSLQEYYVTLGNASTKNFEWEEKPGVEVYINTEYYRDILQVVFEAYVHLAAAHGKMHVKLVNVTDGHDVWESEVSTESDQVVRLEAPIKLDLGNKLYRIAMKSTIRELAILDNARIKIIAK